MKTNHNLFNVLVLGGALLSTAAGWAQEISIQEPINQAIGPMFCAPDDTNTCEVAVVDNQCKTVPKQGIICCWGTSCD